MAKKRVSKNQDDKVFAWLATFLTIIGFIIALLTKRDNDYVMFYAKQGLILFIGQIIISLITPLFFFTFSPVKTILWVFWVILWIMTWINALSGEKRNTWLVSDLAKLIKL